MASPLVLCVPLVTFLMSLALSLFDHKTDTLGCKIYRIVLMIALRPDPTLRHFSKMKHEENKLGVVASGILWNFGV